MNLSKIRGTTMITIPLWAVVLFAITIVLLGILLWSVKRRRKPRLNLSDTGSIKQYLQSIASLTHGTLVEGNAIEIVQNGRYFERLFRDIEHAAYTIDFETFLCKRGDLTRKLADLLAQRARDGIEVRLLVDSSGGKKFGKEEWKMMREAGCRLARYHPLRISNLGLMNNRDHRKIVVIDGRIAWAGGHCFVDTWRGDAEDKEHFRDISIRIQGPVAAQVQSAFSENWIEETGDVPGGKHFFPNLSAKGEAAAHAVYTSPQGSPSSVKMLHYLAIHAAQKQIRIQNPYFLPDPDARKELVAAAGRGVDVRVMIPATTASDSPVVQHASHHHYGTLLGGGIRIFEYQKTLLHQKVMTIDHCWSTIGSTNFDDRSFEVNDEIAIGIYDEAIAQELEEIFEADCKDAVEIELKEWKRRPFWHKTLDGSLFLFNEQL